ncbi:MAG: SDR family oxidoreductase, partial [Bacteroidota bacterium]
MHIILTGATGTLGSQVLFCLLESRYASLEKIYLIVRKKNRITPEERVNNMLDSGSIPDFIQKNKAKVLEKIEVVDAENLLEPHLFLKTGTQHYFIHSAGFVNLSVHPDSKEEIYQENLTLTQNIFKAYKDFVSKFIYISTAFSIGKLDGLLNNNYVDTEQSEYRNFYEASKHAAEKYLVKAGEIAKIPIQILRPSVLGGNIMGNPNFFISKY